MIGIHDIQSAAKKDERKDAIVDEKRFYSNHVIHLERKDISIVKVNMEKTKSTNFLWYPREQVQEKEPCDIDCFFEKLYALC
ncbi:hypothetical protein T458_12390 [Brevibacillus panacihumi W25]|uniref:Uncharacterized protein n=2 Tax=Brevibacillus panacihumi TaxID=497735 RepID=V6M7M5_9BACL|nr:hypothetical protein T458_12390 [Brevibacillus panacihumi W25]RNB78253.1 hypothetical protein EDM58_12185 [Brevibacillus panacihumi]